MRAAALYEIHGNLPALDAVLVDVERERVAANVSGGDHLQPFDRGLDSGLRIVNAGSVELLDPPDPAEATRHWGSARGA